MFKTLFLFLSATLIGTSFIGCAVDECEKYAERSVCQTTTPDSGNGGILTISPRRLNIKGDTVVVTMSAKTSATDDVKITQPGMADVALGKLGNGTVKVPALTSSQLSLGKAYLVVGANAPEPIRFYLSPSYVKSAMNIPTGAEVSLWVGVSLNGNIVSLNDNLSLPPPVHSGEYGYQSKQLKFNGGFNYPSSAKGSSSIARKFIGYPNPYIDNTVLLRSCNLGTDTCDNIQTANKSLLDMAVNRSASILGAILDNQLMVYFIDASFGAATSHLANSAILTPKLIATDDLDGDGLSDFVVWNGKVISVLRQSRSGGTIAFNLDMNLSTLLTTAFGNDKPTALVINDVDGDGLQDVVYTTVVNAMNQVIWLANAPDAAVKFTRGGPLNITSGSADSLAVGDVDLDNKMDIVISSKSDNTIKTYINQATY
ncbi:MAG TPA: VCBS repeat-containing protein [Pseudomonadota bacterium]|nr:VCBS repeat-containing protein [Pseudomonadota bacterium]